MNNKCRRRIHLMFHENASPNHFEGDMTATNKWLCYLLCIVVSLLLGNIAYSNETTEVKSSADVLARVGDEVITQKDLDAYLNRLPERKRAQYRDKTLNMLIEYKVFSNEARKTGLDKDPKIMEKVEKATNETLARDFVKKDIDTKAEPSQEEIEKFYQEHKEQFVVPEGVLIEQIVARNRKDAEAILEELKKGASFEDLARKESIAPSSKDGGRLGWLYKGMMDPEVEKAAFSMEKGKLSDIIETKAGYEIIKLDEKSEKREVKLDEAKPAIRNQLFWKKRGEIMNEYYKEAKVDRKPSEKGVLLKIGDETFREDAIPPVPAGASESEKENFLQRWVNYLVDTTVFSREARKAGLEKDPEVADELKRTTDQILADAFSKSLREKFLVSDSEAAAYYQTHQEEFRAPAKVLARAVIMKTQEDAEMIKEKLEKGVAFEALAAKNTGYYDKIQTADLGWFGKGEKDPQIEKAAFALEKGQVSDIIKTDGDYMILKVLQKGGGGVRPFDEVKEFIRMKMMAPKFREAKQQYYEKAGVKILRGNIK
jgi:peptidyl-prolyl cis-trans isomerase C